jgi:hypothetical protein
MTQPLPDKDVLGHKYFKTDRPSKAFVKTIKMCSCGYTKFKWLKENRTPSKCTACGDTGSYYGKYRGDSFIRGCYNCGRETTYDYVGEVVKLSCPFCNQETDWHKSNSSARSEWNSIN